jgi:hypothetical protein
MNKLEIARNNLALLEPLIVNLLIARGQYKQNLESYNNTFNKRRRS